MIKNYTFLLLFIGTILGNIQAQNTPFCHFGPLLRQQLNDKDIASQYAKNEHVMHQKAMHNIESRSAIAANLPVVVHVLQSATNPKSLTNLEIEKGISALNQIFANQAPFQSPKGVNSNLQFCLAKADPQGKISNGITRDDASVLYAQGCTIDAIYTSNDLKFKALNTWNPKKYLNIWIVDALRDECGNCSLNSYAYSALFGGTDGLVMTQKAWVSEPKTIAHEIGHTLGLYHTFHQGCRNDDCLIDGDLVCDTPPDVAQYADCSSNSCNTDAKSGAPNPFSSDVLDDNSNIMDLSDCPNFHFTTGQVVRMNNYISTQKPMWLTNNLCNGNALDVLTIDSIKLQNNTCFKTFCPKIVITNNGVNDIKTLKINILHNAANTTEDWTGKIAVGETKEIQLPCLTAILNKNTLKIDITFVNGNPHTNLFDNNIQTWNVAETPKITNVKSTATNCNNNGTLFVTASKGATPYIYSLAGISAQQTTQNFAGLTFGPYNVIVTDANMCSDTLPVAVKDSCLITKNNGFIVNGNATLQAGDCITITEAQKNKVGSVWYKDKISLKRSFDVFYSMNLGCNDANGADGMAFVLQPISTSIGQPGAGMGYQSINPSLAVEFDTWANNQFGDPTYDHTAITIDGELNHAHPFNLAGPVPILGTTAAPKNAEDCAFHKVRINWYAPTQTITVYIDCVQKLTYTGDLIKNAFFGISDVYLGFTASTGNSTNKHQVCFEHVSFLDELEEKTICAGTSIQVSANKNFKSYEWLPNQDLDNNLAQSPKFFPKQTTFYTLKMTDQCGYSIVDTLKINVINPSISTLAIDNEPCTNVANNLVKITNPKATDGFTFSFDGKSFSSNNQLIYNTLGVKTVYAQKGNCTSSAVFELKKAAPLKLDLLYDKVDGCFTKRTFEVKASGGTEPYLYRISTSAIWQADGKFIEKLNNITLEVKDANNCVSSLNIENKCVPFSFVMLIDSSKLIKTCVDSSTFVKGKVIGEYGNIFYKLDNGKLQDNSIFEALKVGKHILYAKSDEGCTLDSIKFEVVDKTQKSVAIKDTTICEGSEVDFVNKKYSKTGIYTIDLKTYYGCDSTLTLKLKVNPKQKSSQKLVICEGDFYAIGKNKYTKTGVFIDTLSSKMTGCDSVVTTNLKVTKQDTVSYKSTTCDTLNAVYVVQKLKNKYGCDSTFINDVKYIAPSRFTLKQSICESAELSINGKTYNKDKTFGTERLIGAAKSGCDSIVEIQLTVNQILAEFSNTDPTCFDGKDGSVLIQNIKNGVPPYQLKINDEAYKNIGNPQNVKDLGPGITYFKIRDNIGCELQTSVFLKNPKALNVDLGTDKYIYLGDSVELKPSVDFVINKMFWQSQNGVSCKDCPTLWANPIKRGAYTVTVFDAKNCKASGSVNVIVQKGENIYVPTAFSPNIDNNNDRFAVFPRKSVKKVNNFRIFDRWGELIFEQESIDFNDYKSGWDGTFRGELMPSDVYVYSFELLLIDDSTEKISGNVFLMQ